MQRHLIGPLLLLAVLPRVAQGLVAKFPLVAQNGGYAGTARGCTAVLSTANANCTGTTDDTANVTTQLANAAGGTLCIASGCMLLSTGPSAAGTTYTQPTNTTIECEDKSAGFVLPKKTCVGGSTSGAACTTGTDCVGSTTCTITGGVANVFAPTQGSSYTLLKAAASSTMVQLENCTINANGADDRSTCAAGSRAALPCAVDGDCPASVCFGVSGFPNGKGKTNLVDYSTSTFAVIENVAVSNVRDASFVFSVGTSGRVRNSDTTGYVAVVPTANVKGVESAIVYTQNAKITGNVVNGADSVIRGGVANVPDSISNNVIDASGSSNEGCTANATPYACCTGNQTGNCQSIGIDSAGELLASNNDIGETTRLYMGVRLAGLNNTISANHISATAYGVFEPKGLSAQQNSIVNNNMNYGSAANAAAFCTANVTPAYCCTAANTGATCLGTAILVNGYQDRIAGNLLVNFPNCIKGEIDAYNVTVDANRCYGGSAAMLLGHGAGWKISNNYLAWTTGTPVIQISDNGTYASPSQHWQIVNNLLFSTHATPVGIAFGAPGKRCNGGTKVNQACTNSDTIDCPAATCGTCCIVSDHTGLSIIGNEFLSNNLGVDFSPLTTNTTVTGGNLSTNLFSANTTGIKFPSLTTLITKLSVTGNAFGDTTTPIATGANTWNWLYGNLFNNTPMGAADEQVAVTQLSRESGDTAGQGDAVEVSTVTLNSFKRAGFLGAVGSKKAIGILLDNPSGTNVGMIAVGGATTCNVESGVVKGVLLTTSNATAGRLTTTTAAADNAVAIALGDAASNKARCLLWPQPASPAANTATAHALLGGL